ncbi:carbon-monoxide dehydrogenase medium subunit [Bradyrhizobium sp. AZCC 1678]|uniref:FAD binding domain-containing protein n=1 Tax=Bradyrhizobium sp. AZCC 1678 TaxID=3117030 RepID=UPI002FF3189A
MKPAPFEYHAPTSLDEAATLLAGLQNAKILAGGQSLVPMLNFRYVIVDHIVALENIRDLAGITMMNGVMRIGAMTRQRELEYSDLVSKHCPLLKAALAYTGHRQTRNRGTIGGSLCHADPSAEQPTVCASHDAIVELHSVRGRRRVQFSEFGTAFMTTAVEPDEILCAVELPLWGNGHGYGFHEFARRHGDFAIVASAALIQLGSDGSIARASVALAGIGNAPLRMPAIEQHLVGRRPDPMTLRQAAILASDIEPITDIHAGPDYRRQLARVLTERALADAARRAAGEV